MNCRHCGAPLESEIERCPFCGQLTSHGEDIRVREREKIKRDEKRQKLAGLVEMKCVSEVFVSVIYVFTLGLYGIYWYATRMGALNKLCPHIKFPAWPIGVEGLAWICFIIFDEGPLLDISILTMFGVSVWMAFRVRKILQAYALQYLDKSVLINVIAPSGIGLLLFGPIYLQHQINKMIRMELLALKV